MFPTLPILAILILQFIFSLQQGKPEVVCHRGFGASSWQKDFPENTLMAFKQALSNGFKYAECDIRYTKDKHIVLMHDASVDRTTDGKGKGLVKDLTLDQIKKLDAGKGERVPLLFEVLQLFKQYPDAKLFIDVKDPNMEKDTIRMIQHMGLIDRVNIIAFSYDVLRKFRNEHPTVELGYLVNPVPSTFCEDLKKINGSNLGVQYQRVNQKVVEEAKKCGVYVWSWSPMKREEILDHCNWGTRIISSELPFFTRDVIEEWTNKNDCPIEFRLLTFANMSKKFLESTLKFTQPLDDTDHLSSMTNEDYFYAIQRLGFFQCRKFVEKSAEDPSHNNNLKTTTCYLYHLSPSSRKCISKEFIEDEEFAEKNLDETYRCLMNDYASKKAFQELKKREDVIPNLRTTMQKYYMLAGARASSGNFDKKKTFEKEVCKDETKEYVSCLLDASQKTGLPESELHDSIFYGETDYCFKEFQKRFHCITSNVCGRELYFCSEKLVNAGLVKDRYHAFAACIGLNAGQYANDVMECIDKKM